MLINHLTEHGKFKLGGLWGREEVPILRRDLSKVRLDNRTVAALIEPARITSSTEVLPPFLLHGGVDALGCLARKKVLDVGLRDRSREREPAEEQDGGQGELHRECWWA